jgi:hypothetical protein
MRAVARYTLALVLLIPMLFSASRQAIAETLMMPRDLVTDARENHCSPIEDFFERPGMVGPPFVYGYLEGDEANSAVFWCEQQQQRDKRFSLVVVTRNGAGGFDCPRTFIWWNRPGGLSIETRQNLSLKTFHYIKNPRKPGPNENVARARVIVSEYDGLVDTFYCNDGDWLYQLKD